MVHPAARMLPTVAPGRSFRADDSALAMANGPA